MAACKNSIFILLVLVAALVAPVAGCIPAIQQQPAAPAASSAPVMVVNPDKLVFTINQGQGPTLEQLLLVTNQGGGILNQSMSDNAQWIVLQPAPGTSTTQTCSACVNIDATGMATGQYTGIITLTDDGALNSPIYVPVYLTILPGANIPPGAGSPPAPSSIHPGDSAAVWVNQTDFYQYADVSALVVSGSVTNTDRGWNMADVKITAPISGNNVTVAAQIPPGETVMYKRYIPSFQKDTVKLSYTWYKP